MLTYFSKTNRMKHVFLLGFLLLTSQMAISQCPVINSAMVNSCGATEGINEFVVFTTSVIAPISSYSLYYGSNNPASNSPTGKLLGTNVTTKSGMGTIVVGSSCTLHEVTTPGTSIPAGSVVIFIPADFEAQYDASGMCSNGHVYVAYIDRISNSDWNANGTLANSPSGTRYIQIMYGSDQCSSHIRSFNMSWPSNTDGNAIFWNGINNPSYINNGCNVIAPPSNVTLSITQPASICKGTTNVALPYTATGTPNTYSIDWNAAAQAAGLTDIVNATLNTSPVTIAIPANIAAGTYTGTITATNTTTGMSSTAQTVTITVLQAPVVNAIGGNTSVCEGATLTLTNTTTGGTWSSSNTNVATINSSGVVTAITGGTTTITYTVTNTCGSNNATTTVTVNAKPVVADITGSNTLCVSSTTTLSNATASGTWSVTPTSIATITNGGTVTGIAVGTATVTYTVANGCGSTSKTYGITVADKPTVAAITGNNNIEAGNSTQLQNTTNGGTWSITPVTIASIDNTGKVTGITAGTATASYTVTNACGSTEQTLPITVTAPPNANVFIPNAFTPNGDGNNDAFRVYSNKQLNIELRIFNQWGELITTLNSSDDTWDGRYKNKLQPTGVYMYAARIVMPDGKTAFQKGSLLLIR